MPEPLTEDALVAGLTTLAETIEAMVDEMKSRSERGPMCAECGRDDDGEPGWQAHLSDDEPPVAVLFCSECAEREFGGDDA